MTLAATKTPIRAFLALLALTATLAGCTTMQEGEECEPGVEDIGAMTDVLPTCT